MKIKFNIKYLCAFLVLFAIEFLIAVFAKGFIRESIGDVLVTPLIYCFLKIFIKKEIKLLWLWIFIFAVVVEVLQYFNLVDLLGLEQYRIARIIIGTTFAFSDIICYLAGCLGVWGFEAVMRKISKK